MDTGIFTSSPFLNLFGKLAVAALIGMLIGMERESRSKKGEKTFGGIRTFPLIAILGFVAALVADQIGPSIYIAFFTIFGVLVGISYFFAAKKGEFGATTEISFLIIFSIGSLVYLGYIILSAAIAVIMGIFLAFKTEFRSLVGKIEQEDIYATIKFAILTIIILPLLPNEAFGPFNAFNLKKIWLMVILIAGVSFVGFFLFKIIGTKRGIQLISLLGGIASSTALTLSFTERSKEVEPLSRNFAAGIVMASSIMFPRVLLIILLLSPAIAKELLIPFSIFTVVGITSSLLLWRKSESPSFNEIQLTNPFKVMFALKFGLVFAIVLLISNAANFYFGDQGVYISSFFSGFADVDAIALTIADLYEKSLALNVAVMSVIIGCGANSLVKLGVTLIFGAKELKKYSFMGFSTIIASIAIYLIAVTI